MKTLKPAFWIWIGLIGGLTFAAADPKTRFKIDAHFHFDGDSGFVEKTVNIYRQYNTVACVLTPLKHLARVKAAVQKYPDVFVGFGSIKLDDPEALAKIDSFYAAGFKGVGELSKPRYDFNDPRYFPIYEKLEKLKLHALFHTGIVARYQVDRPESTGMSHLRPSFLDEIARRYPALTIQGAHLGNPWYEEAAEAARWNPNLYFDLTGSSLLKKKDDPAFWGKVLWWRPELATPHSPARGHAFEKIVFGTDEGPEGLLENIERFQKVLDANKVPEEVREKCWGGTMAKILGVSPR